ncbi:hypothetical protein BAL199_28865 [alpha proteobacterium BAL199]|nr:hypothetical protein BAL199_28865 [alpha proteobacterium BAL199]
MLIHRVKGLGDALFRDGDVVRGGAAILDGVTGSLQLEAASIYVRGAVRPVPAAGFTIPVDTSVAIGVRLTEIDITELEDPTLLDPGVGTRNYQEPGAWRARVSLAWGWTGDGAAGQFIPVYLAENGVLVNQTPPPQLDGVTQALARYDREANGSYVVSGFRVTALPAPAGQLVFSVEEGIANVDGFKVTRNAATRLAFTADPDLATVESEPHLYSGGGAAVRITLNRRPVETTSTVSLVEVRLTRPQPCTKRRVIGEDQVVSMTVHWSTAGSRVSRAGSGAKAWYGLTFIEPVRSVCSTMGATVYSSVHGRPPLAMPVSAMDAAMGKVRMPPTMAAVWAMPWSRRSSSRKGSTKIPRLAAGSRIEVSVRRRSMATRS